MPIGAKIIERYFKQSLGVQNREELQIFDQNNFFVLIKKRIKMTKRQEGYFRHFQSLKQKNYGGYSRKSDCDNDLEPVYFFSLKCL